MKIFPFLNALTDDSPNYVAQHLSSSTTSEYNFFSVPRKILRKINF